MLWLTLILATCFTVIMVVIIPTTMVTLVATGAAIGAMLMQLRMLMQLLTPMLMLFSTTNLRLLSLLLLWTALPLSCGTLSRVRSPLNSPYVHIFNEHQDTTASRELRLMDIKTEIKTQWTLTIASFFTNMIMKKFNFFLRFL